MASRKRKRKAAARGGKVLTISGLKVRCHAIRVKVPKRRTKAKKVVCSRVKKAA